GGAGGQATANQLELPGDDEGFAYLRFDVVELAPEGHPAGRGRRADGGDVAGIADRQLPALANVVKPPPGDGDHLAGLRLLARFFDGDVVDEDRSGAVEVVTGHLQTDALRLTYTFRDRKRDHVPVIYGKVAGSIPLIDPRPSGAVLDEGLDAVDTCELV